VAEEREGWEGVAADADIVIAANNHAFHRFIAYSLGGDMKAMGGLR